MLGDAVSFVERWVGGIASVHRRLEQLGGEMSVEQFGPNGSSGAASGWPLRSGSHARVVDGADPVALLTSAGVLMMDGVLGRDWWLTRQVAQREQRMLEEFPAITELLALAVTAGKGPVGAAQATRSDTSSVLA